MKLRNEQLTAHLQKNLAPVYLITGDVPLLAQEAQQAICHRAQLAGYKECRRVQIEAGFDWNQLLLELNSFSLFATRKLFVLRLFSNKLNEAGSKAIQTYLSRLSSDTLLILVMEKLESSAQNSAWFKAIDQAGVIIQIWPVELSQMPRWIEQRLASVNIQTTAAGIQLLAEKGEGNLLAAAQEIEKLHLLYGSCKLTTEQIEAAIVDNARFDVFNFVDTLLQGENARAVRILKSLQAEGIEPTLILWALTRELRILATLAWTTEQGRSVDAALQAQRVYEKRKALLKRAVQRHSVLKWRRLIQQAAEVDRIIKGMEVGNVWDALSKLSLRIAGTELQLSL